jgi:hypothetical protein
VAKNRRGEISLEPGTVYFIGERDLISREETQYVKIGLTKLDRSSEERESDLKVGNPRELFIMHEEYVPLVHSVERALRYEFRLQNVVREWHVFRSDSPRKLEAAISRCKDLGSEFAAYVPVVETAKALTGSASNGYIKRESTPEAEFWRREYSLHHHILNLEKAATSSYTTIAKRAFEEGQPAPLGTTTTQEDRKSVNWRKFATEHPAIAASFQIITTKRDFKPEITSPEDLSDPLISEVQGLCDQFYVLLEGRPEEDSLYSNLFRQLLMIEQIAGFSTFRKELARCQLSVLCGDAPGIEGVVAWQTEQVSKLDTKAVESVHSSLVAQYTERRRTKKTVTGTAGEIAGETEDRREHILE